MNKPGKKYWIGMIVSAILIWLYFFIFESFNFSKFWMAWLLNAFYILMILLFGNLFLSFHILANTKWHVKLQPILLLMGKVSLVAILIFTPLLWNMKTIFPWLEDTVTIETKGWYLNKGFFIARTLFAFICWILPVFFISKLTSKNSKNKLNVLAGLITVLTIFTFIVFSQDWLLSICCEWHSSLFGWFILSGMLLSGMSFIVIIYLLSGKNDATTILDSSKYLFSFACVWMYLWFSQFILIWYGNIQHETFYISRQYFNFKALFYFNIVFSFGIPFVLLLSKIQKKSPVLLGISAVSALIGQWINLYITLYPAVCQNTNQNFFPVALFSIFFVLFSVPFIFRLSFKVNKTAGILIVLTLFFNSCDTSRNHPGYEYIPEMTYSRPFQTYSENPNFADSATMRNPVAGTVPREMIPSQYKKTANDRIAAGLHLKNPLDSTTQNINEGRFLYESFCSHCHGEKGDGIGKLYTEKFYTYKPGVLNGDKIQHAPEGEIFHAISEGFNLMGAHKTILLPHERWKIVLYTQSIPYVSEQ